MSPMTIYGAISRLFRAWPESLAVGISYEWVPRKACQLLAIQKQEKDATLSLYPTMTEQNFEWTCWNTQQFIDLIREHPCLWQVRNTNYENKTVMSVSLNTLTKQFTSPINCVITSEMIMKKLHTLRGQYRREVEEMKTLQKSGASTDHLYLSILWCYALAFLSDGDTTWDSTSNLDELLIATAVREAYCLVRPQIPPNPSLKLVRGRHTSPSVY